MPREGADVVRIAVVQDGTELVRQTDADVADCYERCCAFLSADGTSFATQTFTDETVGYLLERIDPDEHKCLVLASNALISERVEHALTGCADRLRGYLANGGGLVVLHQLVDSLANVLPDDLCPGLADRRPGGPLRQAAAHDLGDLLLNFPGQVTLEEFYDGDAAPGPPSLFYKALPAAGLPEKLLPVVACGDEVLLARSYDHVPEHIVVTTIPLDWQYRVELLANAIRFACLGRPRRLVWREETGMRDALFVRWLCADGGASVRPMPGPGEIGPAERWLLRAVDVVVAPHSELSSLSARQEVKRFLAAGGTLLTHDQLPGDAACRVVAIVGSYIERRLANRLYGELRAVRGWDAVDYAFELRNIVLAVCLLWGDSDNRSKMAVSPGELGWLKPLLRQRLADATHREDLSSSIALAQSLAFLCWPEPLRPADFAWMQDDPRQRRFDVGLQIRAVTALATRQPDRDFMAAAGAALGKQTDLGSIAPIIRVLDTVAVLDQAGLLDCDPDGVRELARISCDHLEALAGQSADGWLSVEATADAVRGLTVLLRRLGSDDPPTAERVADLLGRATSVLRQSLGRYQRNRKGVAWLAGVTHAMVQVQRVFPIGTQRLASLDWPERSDDDQEAIGTSLPLLQHLAVANKELRDRERQFEAERTAARVGRAAATLGTVAVIAAGIGYAFAQLGFASVWGLAGNTVLLTVLAGILTPWLLMLRRWNLLAEPAVRALDWIAATIPGFSRLRDRDQ